MGKKHLFLLCCAMIAVTAIAIVQFTTGVIETGAWGLSFRQENTTPIGPASVEELAETENMNLTVAEAVYKFFHKA